MNNKVTIITVCYNAYNVIERTIKSVTEQIYNNIEYIIIDGGSFDGTVDIIENQKSCITKFVSEPDNGIYDAMNKGVLLATGEWVIFLNAGDSFYNKEILSDIFNRSFNCDVIYGDVMIVKKFGSYIERAHSLNSFSNGRIPFCHQSSFVKRELLVKYKFNLNYKVCADYDFFYRLWKDSFIFEYLPATIAKYDISYGSVAASHYNLAIYEELKILGLRMPKLYIKLFEKVVRYELSSLIKLFIPNLLIRKRTMQRIKRDPNVMYTSW